MAHPVGQGGGLEAEDHRPQAPHSLGWDTTNNPGKARVGAEVLGPHHLREALQRLLLLRRVELWGRGTVGRAPQLPGWWSLEGRGPLAWGRPAKDNKVGGVEPKAHPSTTTRRGIW